MVMSLNYVADAKKREPVMDSTVPPAIDKSLITKAPMTVTVRGSQTGMRTSTSTVSDADGSTILTCQIKSTGFSSAKFTFLSPDGATLCSVTGKRGWTKHKGNITAGDELLGTVALKTGLTSAAGTLWMGGTEVYTAQKYTTLQFFMALADRDGRTVAKVAQRGLDMRKNEIELGANVDILSVMVLSTLIGTIMGGNAAVGAAAGAGAI